MYNTECGEGYFGQGPVLSCTVVFLSCPFVSNDAGCVALGVLRLLFGCLPLAAAALHSPCA